MRKISNVLPTIAIIVSIISCASNGDDSRISEGGVEKKPYSPPDVEASTFFEWLAFISGSATVGFVIATFVFFVWLKMPNIGRTCIVSAIICGVSTPIFYKIGEHFWWVSLIIFVLGAVIGFVWIRNNIKKIEKMTGADWNRDGKIG